MEVTLEQVERLREKAPVSYLQARQALEYSGGNLLDALIYLEEQGAIPRQEGAYYSTRSEASAPAGGLPAVPEPAGERKEKKREKAVLAAAKRGKKKGASGPGLMDTLRRWLLENELEIWRRDRPLTALPVLILVLLVVLAPYLTIPVLVLGLFFGLRYRFSGPDLEREEINSVMGNVADTAADLGRQVMNELRAEHEKHDKKNKTDKKDGDKGE